MTFPLFAGFCTRPHIAADFWSASVDDVFVATPCSILCVCDVARRAAR
jgi:hypothetical protein